MSHEFIEFWLALSMRVKANENRLIRIVTDLVVLELSQVEKFNFERDWFVLNQGLEANCHFCAVICLYFDIGMVLTDECEKQIVDTLLGHFPNLD